MNLTNRIAFLGMTLAALAACNRAEEGLDEAERVRELSRMLAGLEDSDTALAHAQELLEAAQESRSRTR